MKRLGRDLYDAGAPGLRPENRRGASRSTRMMPLALSAPPSTAAVRAAGFKGARQRDFEDFVAGDGGWATALRPIPDPDFRDGLRRRLWRIHLLRRSGRGFHRH